MNGKIQNSQDEIRDFPAAHSMDTKWFGVDDLGNIGLFDTGEGGAFPRALGLVHAYTVAEGHAQIEAELTRKKLKCVAFEQDFNLNHNLPGPYDRIGVPDVPADLEDLSPSAQKYAERGRLPGTNFLQMPLIQPAEHVLCNGYGGELDFMISRDRQSLVVLPRPAPLSPESIEIWRKNALRLGLKLVIPDPPNPEIK